MPQQFILTLTTLILLIPALVGAQEQERWYETEVIVFERTDAGRGQVYTGDPLRPAFLDGYDSLIRLIPEVFANTSAADLDPRLNQIMPFRHMGAKALKLGGEYERLVSAPGFRPLGHFIWRQPASGEETLRVRLKSDLLPYEAAPAPVSSLLTPTAPPAPVRGVFFDGWVNVIVGRYLHVEAELHLLDYDAAVLDGPPPVSSLFGTAGLEAELPEARPVLFLNRLQERRRIRLNELHYFDNPRFGILFVVRPHDLPKNEELREMFNPARSLAPIRPKAPEWRQAPRG